MSVSYVSGSAAISALANLLGLSPEAQTQVDAAIAAIRSEMRDNPVGHPADKHATPSRSTATTVDGLTDNESRVLAAIRDGYRSATKVGGLLGMQAPAVNRICGQLGAKGKVVPSGSFFRLAEFVPDPEYIVKGHDIGAMQHALAVVAFLSENGPSSRDAILYGCDTMLDEGEAKFQLWQVTHILHAIADRGLITCDQRSLKWEVTKT